MHDNNPVHNLWLEGLFKHNGLTHEHKLLSVFESLPRFSSASLNTATGILTHRQGSLLMLPSDYSRFVFYNLYVPLLLSEVFVYLSDGEIRCLTHFWAPSVARLVVSFPQTTLLTTSLIFTHGKEVKNALNQVKP
ncbi:hypothetical protein XENORESO_003762 [Xenotaenia resolanae]|uniref:Uncharacterized protein n=1 Tax=Xenotaenia resolanae TaxID=208358 RepID=A0ABV0WEG9_9TELE